MLKNIFFLSTLFGLVVLAILIIRVIVQGASWINMDFLTGSLSTAPDRAGIMGAILEHFGSWLLLFP